LLQDLLLLLELVSCVGARLVIAAADNLLVAAVSTYIISLEGGKPTRLYVALAYATI